MSFMQSDKGNAVKYSTLAFLITFIFLMVEWFASKAGVFGSGLRLYLVDSLFRAIFGTIGIVFLSQFCHEDVKSLCTNRIPRVTWLLLIPIYVYFLSYSATLSMVESTTGMYLISFLGAILQQITTGYFEETVSRGIVMNAFRKHYSKVRWRLAAVVVSGVVFGLGHIFNFLFGGDFLGSLEQAFITAMWGMFLAAIYMVTDHLLLVMVIHAAWDIWIRIPDFFFNLTEEATTLSTIGEITRTIIDPFLLGILAIVICIKYDKINKHSYEFAES